MVKLAAFPKCYMDELCVTRRMSLFEWIEVAAQLAVDGVELYDRFFVETTPRYIGAVKARLRDNGLGMPMMCYSPDFTKPDAHERREEVERQKHVIELTAELGG